MTNDTFLQQFLSSQQRSNRSDLRRIARKPKSMSLGVYQTGVATRREYGSTSNLSFLSSFNSSKTVQQPLSAFRHGTPPQGAEATKSLSPPAEGEAERPRSTQTFGVEVDPQSNTGSMDGATTDGTAKPRENPEDRERRLVEESKLKELTEKLTSSQNLLAESLQREKNLQYRLRQLEAESQVLRRSRAPLVLLIGRHRIEPRTQEFIQYEVCVERFNSASANQVVQYSLWRRYSQFVEMHKQLQKECPPIARAAIPRLPKKKWTGNFEPEFVDRRAEELQWYLQLIASVEPMRRCSAFREFLTPCSGNGILGGDIASGERNLSSDALVMVSAKDLTKARR